MSAPALVDAGVPSVEEAELDVVRAVAQVGGLGLASVAGLGTVGLAVGAPAPFALGLLVAPVIAAVHTVALCVPGLLVAQALLALDTSARDTLAAELAGLRQGATLLAAAVPLVLFFGVSLGTPRSVAVLCYAAGALALAAAQLEVTRTLVRAEPRWAARAVHVGFGALGFAVGLLAGADALVWIGGAPWAP